jgi:hypothetical protein
LTPEQVRYHYTEKKMPSVTIGLGDKAHSLNLEQVGESTENRWTARCRLPFDGLLSMPAKRSLSSDQETIVNEESSNTSRDLVEVSTRADEVQLEGIASSTSVDWHGTEMSIEALNGMARQFKAGVPYVPSHREDEWDQVFGRTVDAEVVEGRVINAAETEGATDGHLLRVITNVYVNDPRGKLLMDMVDRGQTIGWSIGGWFTELTVLTNESDEVERIIIQGVELDHLATTRRPSNPDSWIGELSRSVSGAIAQMKSPTKERQMTDLENEVVSSEEKKAPNAPSLEMSEKENTENHLDRSEAVDHSNTDKAGEVVEASVDIATNEELDCIKDEESPLDMTAKTSKHSEEDNEAQRSQSAFDSDTDSPKQEEGAMSDQANSEMTEATADGSAEIAATLADMRTLLQSLVSRESEVDNDNNKPAVKVEPAKVEAVDPDIDLMRGRIAELEGLVGKLAAAPQRRGHSHQPAERSLDLTSTNIVVRAAEQELGAGSALVAVAKEQAQRRSAGADNLPSRAQLEADLRSILHAALADGVITDPQTRSSWR